MKTIVFCTAVIFLVILNVLVVRNPAFFVPSKESLRLYSFYLNPEFWPGWWSQVLWILAFGTLAAVGLRTFRVQRKLERLAQKLGLIGVVTPPFLEGWFQKISVYPVERRLLQGAGIGLRSMLFLLRPYCLPYSVLSVALLIACADILAHTGLWSLNVAAVWKSSHSLIIWTLRFPYVFADWIAVSPLVLWFQKGIVSWRLLFALCVPFGLIMSINLYGRKIKRTLARPESKRLLIHYTLIVFVVYLLFLPSLNTQIRCIYSGWGELMAVRMYDYFIWWPFYLYLNEGIITWKTAVYVFIFLFASLCPYLLFRGIYYSRDRMVSLSRTWRVLAFPTLLLVYFYYKALWSVLMMISDGGFLIYQHILRLPTLMWDCVYFAPCYFLFISGISWKLIVPPVLLAIFVLGLLYNPFRRLATRINISAPTLYAAFWTLLLLCCFFLIVWKLVLIAGLVLLARRVAGSGLPAKDANEVQGQQSENNVYRWVRKLVATGVFFISLLTVLAMLNIFCYIILFSSERGFHWNDMRYWPLWVMILPISLVTLSLAGLELTRKKTSSSPDEDTEKQKDGSIKVVSGANESGSESTNCSHIAVFAIVVASLTTWCGLTVAAEPRIVVLEEAKYVSASEARDAGKMTSQAGQGGFLANASIVDCFAAMEYKYTGGRYDNEPIHFRLRGPAQIEPGKKYPMIIWLHGRGESGSDNTRQLAHLQLAMEFFAGPHQRNFFMLATQCPGDNSQWTHSLSQEGKGDAPMTVTAEIVEALLHEYPIDATRLSVFGFSSGGTGAWEYARKSPHKLAALGACSGNPVAGARPEEYLGPAIWAFNNTGDAAVSADDAVIFIDGVNSAGGNAYLSLYKAAGHDTWTRAMREEKIIGWLILQSLEKGGPPQGMVCRPLTKTQQITMFALPVVIMIVCSVSLLRNRRKEFI
ncbi:MAG: alpha/beta hydrolase-fold protein [Planctomycetia bacterium]|nr:alpha/beta hydrolase-fold protein [Planctomycetia bacterium]